MYRLVALIRFRGFLINILMEEIKTKKIILSTHDTSKHLPAVFKFRKWDKAKNLIPESKFETFTFKHFFPRLLNTFNHLDLTQRSYSLRLQVNLNLIENLNTFLIKFPKFEVKYSVQFHKQKKSSVKKEVKIKFKNKIKIFEKKIDTI